jgi:hypothetical protein
MCSDWVNNSLGGILYVIFWSLTFFLFSPKANVLKLTLLVFIITCCIEFSQLWRPELLEKIRSVFIGRILIGTSFSWLDMVHYLMGLLTSFALLTKLRKIETEGFSC